MPPSFKSNFFRSLTGSALAQAVSVSAAFVMQLVAARVLGPSSYGIFVVAWTWVIILAIPCSLGFQTSLLRLVPEYRTHGRKSDLGGLALSAAASVLLASALAAISLVMGAWLSSDSGGQSGVETFALAAGILPMLSLLGVAEGLLKGSRRVVMGQVVQRGLPPILGTAAIGFLWFTADPGAPHVMAVLFVATAISVVIAGFWTWSTLAPFIRGVRPSYRLGLWLRVSMPMVLMASMQILFVHFGTIMVSWFESAEEAGIYAAAARLSQLAAFGLEISIAVVAPRVAEFYARREWDSLRRIVRLAAIGISVVTLALAGAAALFGESVLALFGPGFVQGYPVLLILLLGQVGRSLFGPVALMLTMTGCQVRAAMIYAKISAAILPATLVLTVLFGTVGAAVGTALSLVGVSAWMWLAVWQRHEVNTSVLGRSAVV